MKKVIADTPWSVVFKLWAQLGRWIVKTPRVRILEIIMNLWLI